MIGSSFAEILLLALLPLLSRGAQVSDLLSLLDPGEALEAIGEKTDEASIKSLIEGKEPGAVGAEATYDKKEAEGAIQNLASATESVRDKAREKLSSFGPGIRARLEEVIAKDARRADEAKKVLATLEASKLVAGQRKNTARQLAIRFAGEKSLASLIPSLREAQKAQDPFVARAAAESLALIEKKTEKPAEVQAPLSGAVEALSKKTGVLLALQLAGAPGVGGEPIRLNTLVRQLMQSLPFGPDPQSIDKMLKEMTQNIVQFTVAYGNVRPSSVYVANVGSVGPQGGGVAIIATGDYDRLLLESGLEKNSGLWTVGEVEGRKVFTSVAARILPLDDHTVLVLPQVASKNFPLKEYLTSLKEGKRTLRSEARWERFLETLKGPSILRALAITDADLMSEVWKELDEDPGIKPEARDGLKGMKELELDISAAEEKKIRVRAEGTFAEADQAKGLVQFLKDTIQEGIADMERAVSQVEIPQLKGMIETVKGIKISAEAKKGILRMEIDPVLFIGSFGAAIPATAEEDQ